MNDTTRTEWIKVRCFADEKKKIVNKARREKKNVSAYMREAALEKRTDRKRLREEKVVKDVLSEITLSYNQYLAGVDKEKMMENVMEGVEQLCLFLR